MKSKLKRGIIITVLTLVGICLIYVVYIAFFTGLRNNSEYMDTLDKAFGGNCTIKQTNRRLETYSLPVVKIQIPYFVRTYEISYTDHNGKNRSFSFDCAPFYGDRYFMSFETSLRSELDNILMEDFANEILDKYFDGELEYYDPTREISYIMYYGGKGYTINVMFVENASYIYSKSELSALCDVDLETFAADADDMTNIIVAMNIDKKLENEKDEYIDKIKQAVEYYSSISDREPYYEISVALVDYEAENELELIYDIWYLDGRLIREVVNGEEISK